MMPKVEEWALWAVPKASLTKMSPSLASSLLSSSSHFSSPLRKRMFSRRRISFGLS